MNFARPKRIALMAVLFCGLATPAVASQGADHATRVTVETAGPPRRAPHDSAKKLADQLARAAGAVAQRLERLPPARTDSERGVQKEVAAFATESDSLRRHLTRYLVDKKPAHESLERLNKIAWSMHKSLDKAPRYKAIWSDWARTVSILRRLQKSMPRR